MSVFPVRFTPIVNGTTLASIGTSSSETVLPGQGNAVRVFNAGTATVFIDFAIVNTGTASASTSMPIPSGDVEYFCIANNPTVYAQGISGSASQSVYFTRGDMR